MMENLLEKHQRSISEVSFLRGEIITKTIDLEFLIGVILIKYFILPKKQSDFLIMALSDPYFSFGLKINLLSRVLYKIKSGDYKQIRTDLIRINILRNRFAHSKQMGFDGDLMYLKCVKSSGFKQARDMYNEFIKLYFKVQSELIKVIKLLPKTEL